MASVVGESEPVPPLSRWGMVKRTRNRSSATRPRVAVARSRWGRPLNGEAEGFGEAVEERLDGARDCLRQVGLGALRLAGEDADQRLGLGDRRELGDRGLD